MPGTPTDATVLLRALNEAGGDGAPGGAGAAGPARGADGAGGSAGPDGRGKDGVFEALYGQLRRLAEQQLAAEPRGGAGHTLQPTALVHEAWLRLADQHGPQWERPAFFFAAAAEAMRRILIEHARRKGRAKRGGGLARLPLEGVEPAAPADADWAEFDDCLAALAIEDPRSADVVRLRVYAGLGVKAAAEALGISTATVKREWAYGRAWMRERLGEREGRGAGAGVMR